MLFDKKPDRRVTAKDVLRSALDWKHAYDVGQGRPKYSDKITLELYDRIAAYEKQEAVAAIDREVFDDPLEGG